MHSTVFIVTSGSTSSRCSSSSERHEHVKTGVCRPQCTTKLLIYKLRSPVLPTHTLPLGAASSALLVATIFFMILPHLVQKANTATALADHCYYHAAGGSPRYDYDLDEDNDYFDDTDRHGKRPTLRHACAYKAQPVPIDMDFLRDVNQFFGLTEPGDDEVGVYAPIRTRGIVEAEKKLHQQQNSEEQREPDHNRNEEQLNKTFSSPKSKLAFLFDENDGTVGVVSFQPHRERKAVRHKFYYDERRGARRSQPHKNPGQVHSLPTALQFALELHGKHYVIDVERVPLVAPQFDVDFIGPAGVTENYQVDTAHYYDCHYRGKIYEMPCKRASCKKRVPFKTRRNRGRTKLDDFQFEHRRSGTAVGVAAVSHCPVITDQPAPNFRTKNSNLRSELGTASTAEKEYTAPQMNALHALLKFDASSDRYVIEPLHVYVQHRFEKAQFDADAADVVPSALEKTGKFAQNSFKNVKIFSSSTADKVAHSAVAHKTKQVTHEIGESQAVKTSEKFASDTYAGASKLAHRGAQTQPARATGRFAKQAWSETKKDANVVGSFVSKKAVKAKHYVADDGNNERLPDVAKRKRNFNWKSYQNSVAKHKRKNFDQLSVVHKLFHSADGIDMPGVVFEADNNDEENDAISFQRPQQVNPPTPKDQPEDEEVERFAPSATTAPVAVNKLSPILSTVKTGKHPSAKFDTKPEPNPFWLKLAAFVDYEMYTRIAQLYKTKQEKVNLILATFNAVQMLYSDGTLREIQPHLLLRTLKWSASADRNLPTHGNVVDYMAAFCSDYQPNFIRDFSNGQQVWDLAVVLTGLDVWGAAADVTKDPAYRGLKSSDQKLFAVTGVAYTGGVCTDGKNCAVIEYMKLMSASDTIAHEIGHSLSMKHDGSDNNCDRYAGRIMGRSEHAKERFGWSKCSYDSLKNFLDTGRSGCLHTPPPISKDKMFMP